MGGPAWMHGCPGRRGASKGGDASLQPGNQPLPPYPSSPACLTGSTFLLTHASARAPPPAHPEARRRPGRPPPPRARPPPTRVQRACVLLGLFKRVQRGVQVAVHLQCKQWCAGGWACSRATKQSRTAASRWTRRRRHAAVPAGRSARQGASPFARPARAPASPPPPTG